MLQVPSILEPKLQHRFNVEFEKFGQTENEDKALTMQVVMVKLPNATISSVSSLQMGNLVITLRDDKNNLIRKIIKNRIDAQLNYAGKLFKCIINMLDETGTSIDEHYYSKCSLLSVDYSELDYSKIDACTISLTINISL